MGGSGKAWERFPVFFRLHCWFKNATHNLPLVHQTHGVYEHRPKQRKLTEYTNTEVKRDKEATLQQRQVGNIAANPNPSVDMCYLVQAVLTSTFTLSHLSRAT